MMGNQGGMGEMPGWMVTAMGITSLVWLLVGVAVLVLAVAAIAWLATRLRRDVASGSRVPTALDELDRRYARGEIDRDTYLEARQDLAGR